MKKVLLFLLFFFFIFINTFAIDFDNLAKWNYEITKDAEDNYIVNLSVDIQDGWYIYAINVADGGPLPLFLSFQDSDNIKIIKDFSEITKAKKKYDDVFEMEVLYYQNNASFSASFSVENLSEVVLIIDGQACYIKDGTCVQVYEEIKIKLK
jgi:hypothetical protein